MAIMAAAAEETLAPLRRRRIEFEGLKNLRDVGGVGEMPMGVLYRSEDPLRATASDKRRIGAELQLRTLVDLRTELEVEANGFEDLGAQRFLCEIPPKSKQLGKILGPRIQGGYAKGPVGMAEANELILDVGRDTFARALRAISAPGGLPALIHCTSGKDRTGLFTMLILSFVGANDAEIAGDYALTGEFLPESEDGIEKVKQTLAKFTGAAGEIDDEAARNVLASDPKSALLTLSMLRQVHGSAESYIRKALGFSEEEIRTLRRALTTPPHDLAQQRDPTSKPAAAVPSYSSSMGSGSGSGWRRPGAGAVGLVALLGAVGFSKFLSGNSVQKQVRDSGVEAPDATVSLPRLAQVAPAPSATPTMVSKL